MPSSISSQVLWPTSLMNMPAGAGLEGEGERVAQAEGPDRPVRRPWSLLKNGLSVGDRAVRVDAQHLAEQVAERLRVGGFGVLADADVELAVGPEVDGAAVVVGGALRVSRSRSTTSLPGRAPRRRPR